MTCARVVDGVLLDGDRALVLEEHAAVVVADLHWGYAASHRARGNLFPGWGDETLAARLDALLARHQPRRLAWVGDSLHSLAGRGAAERFLSRLPADLEVHVLAGNHDDAWPLARRSPLHLGRFLLHHGDRPVHVPDGAVEIVGHFHPAAHLADGAGGRAKVPALVEGPRRLVLPAFSDWAGGAPWHHLLGPGERLWVVTSRRVFPLPPTAG